MGDLVNLPIEIQLTILKLLDIQSLLAIRQTCKSICQVTHEKLVWLSLFEKQRQYLPVSHELLHQEDPRLPNYSSWLIESIVRQTQLTANSWPQPRTNPPVTLERGAGSTLMGVEMFLDRWLVVIYSEGVAYLYDIQTTAVLRSCLHSTSDAWASYAISLDSIANKLILAIACSDILRIYEIQLTRLSSNYNMVPDAFHLIQNITLPSHKVKSLNTRERIVVFSFSRTVFLVKWDEDPIPDPNESKIVLTLHPEGDEELWNGIIATHFMGPYILIFKQKSMELHDFISLPSPDSLTPSTSLKHRFPMTFRDVSFSNCSHSRNHIAETDTYTTTLFAYDAIQGLFQYVVQLTISSELPTLQLTLIGIYPLGSGRSIATLQPIQTMTTNSTLTYLGSLYESSNAAQGTRGFVSTFVMGPQGKRAIWVERKRSSTEREIQVWSKEPGDLGSTILVEIERRVVYSVCSYDLAEDVLYCTFSELTGKIVLGSRSGDVSILIM